MLISLVSYESEDKMPNLGGLYTDLAKEDDPDRNPVIVILDVLASTLVEPKSGIVAWGTIGRGLENPKKEEEIRRIALPMSENKTFQDLRDNLVAGSALEGIKVTLYGALLKLTLTPIYFEHSELVVSEVKTIKYQIQLIMVSATILLSSLHMTGVVTLWTRLPEIGLLAPTNRVVTFIPQAFINKAFENLVWFA